MNFTRAFSLHVHSIQRWTVHEWERLLFFNVLALTKRPFWIEKNAPIEHHCSHYTESWTYSTMTYAATNFSWKMHKRSDTQGKNLKKKKARPKTVMINRSMTCIYTTLCSWPWEQAWMHMLLLAFSCTCIHDIVFSPRKKKSLLSLPFADRGRWSVTVCALCRRVPN